MDELSRKALQEELVDLFEQYGVNVDVGLTDCGVAIRSQDEQVKCGARVRYVRSLRSQVRLFRRYYE